MDHGIKDTKDTFSACIHGNDTFELVMKMIAYLII